MLIHRLFQQDYTRTATRPPHPRKVAGRGWVGEGYGWHLAPLTSISSGH